MKRLLIYIFFGIVLISSPANSGAIGQGELTLHPDTVKDFINYIRGGHTKAPNKFVVTYDGLGAMWWWCSAGQANCQPGGDVGDVNVCENELKTDCGVFARGRTVKWRNGINKGNKESRINSKWSDAEIIAKLTELGFLGNRTQKIEKIQTSQTNDTSDITKQLKSLIEMYESGTITKEEFVKAKKKLLD